MADYTKQRIALRYWLLGAGFHQAAEALNFAEHYHSGTRRDGTTPELSHQVSITSYVRTLLPHLRHGQESLCIALLHDVREDYDVADSEIRDLFGSMVADGVDAMTKTFRGHRRDDVELFDRMSQHPCASIVKPADRVHNQDTMVGVFGTDKIAGYIAETRELFLPMVKKAARRFPDQEPAYQNVKLILRSQLDLVDAFLDAQTGTQ
jgi:(p)ppGpp synthase/HD superfamily hydrolase